jgi:Uma2 family endonuclease
MSVSLIPDARVRMNVEEFLAWSEQQPDEDRYELVDGEVVPMSPESYRHSLVKSDAAHALRVAVDAAGVPCRVLTDGPLVVINGRATRKPDVVVRYRSRSGVMQDPKAPVLAGPLIVLEVVSPSSEKVDLLDKLVEYNSVPSIQHYLIVHPEKRAVVHHKRNDQGDWSTSIRHDGDIALDPPGIKVAIADLIGPDDSETDW